MLQTMIVIGIFFLLIIPTGKYLYLIATGKPSFGDKFFNAVEGPIFKLCGIDNRDMSWKEYAGSMVVTNLIMGLVGYFILRIQFIGLFNPNSIGSMEPSLSFNTVISFITNTNLQHYSGESGLSYLSQMIVIIFMMFTSAATGYSVFIGFITGLAGKTKSLGNFYVNMVRVITRVLLPLAIVIALVLVSQGVPQNLDQNVRVQTIEGKYQDIAMGPVAALESIKHLGTNGGGFFGANSSTPFENSNTITNMIEMLSMMLLPGACVVAFGHMVSGPIKKRKDGKYKLNLISRQALPILGAMSIIFVAGIVMIFRAEMGGNPILENIGLSQAMGNMEGKEVRFGISQSALFATVTTAFTTGSVNNMHDTLTPLGGAVALMNMMLNVVFGGKGVGMMNMILYAILAVFICGLMIGRTPEYLGKKIEAKEMKLTALGIIIHPLLILSFTALAVCVPGAVESVTNPGNHGLTQVVYEYASSAANNGSGFEGLADNTVFWNISTGLVMALGRYVSIFIQLAIAGSLLLKNSVNESFGTLKTDTITFTISLLMVVIVIAALTFFPVMVLGPISDHLKL